MSDDAITAAEYRAEIDALAESVIEELLEYTVYDIDSDWFEDEMYEAVFETVDSHQWIIYTHYHLEVICAAEREPDEWHIYVDLSTATTADIFQAMAFDVLLHDVSEAAFDRLAELRESDN